MPPKPADFNPVSFKDEEHRGLVPSRMPGSATCLAQLEWAWSPMNNANVRFNLSLNRVKSHWIGWIAMYNDSETPWHWETDPYCVAERGSANRDVIAVNMLRGMLEGLRDGMGYDRFHWINSGGYLGVHRIEAIGDVVWGHA